MWWPIEKLFGKKPGEHGFSFFILGGPIMLGSISVLAAGSIVAGLIMFVSGALVTWFGGWLMLVALDRKLGGSAKAPKEPWNAMPKPPPPLHISSSPESQSTSMDWTKWREAWESVWDYSTTPGLCQSKSEHSPESEQSASNRASRLQEKFLREDEEVEVKQEEEEESEPEEQVEVKKKVVHEPVQRILVGGKSKPERVQKKMDAIKEKRQYSSAKKRAAKAPRKNRVSSRTRVVSRRASRKFVANF